DATLRADAGPGENENPVLPSDGNHDLSIHSRGVLFWHFRYTLGNNRQEAPRSSLIRAARPESVRSCGGSRMSAAPSLKFEETPRRVPRHPINVPLDLIALRSGVPENLPGRCTDLSEAGVGAVVAGELAAGQQVAVELRLPN